MELVEFMRANKGCFSLSGIENRLGLRKDTLKDVLRGRRILSNEYADLLIGLFNMFDVDLDYTFRDKRSPTHGLVAIDSSWQLTVSGKWIKDGVKVDVVEIGGKNYYEP